ncbi:MAG TPA: type II toxin-antitoxin system death-on-curing family toxin [Rugosimonospora sp.]|nr:type II toxin-antitoxin system death-on-curing family toxin [Rugosimonospora sp.]
MSAWMLQADYLEFIHDALVALLWPGTEPIGEREQRDRRLIESAAARPFHTLLGEDAYPTIPEKAVALFHSIIANHAFLNGNKRTAVIAIDHFLTVNDHYLALTNDPMYKLAEQTASYKERGLSQDQSLAEITEMIEENVICMDIVRHAIGPQEEFLKTVRKFDEVRDWIRNTPLVSMQD